MIVYLGIAFALIIIVVVLALLLTRRLREKYAVLWLLIGLVVLVLGIFPQLLYWLTGVLGVELPVNLLFAIAIVLLLGVALHLSWELSQAEDEIRRSGEEIAILRAQHVDVARRISHLEGGGTAPRAGKTSTDE